MGEKDWRNTLKEGDKYYRIQASGSESVLQDFTITSVITTWAFKCQNKKIKI